MTAKRTGNTGNFEIKYPDEKMSGTVHTVQFTVRDSTGVVAVPATGTVTITVKTPDGGDYEAVPDNAIALTDRANWTQTLTGIHVEAMHFALPDLEVGHTLDTAVSASFGGA